MFSVWILFKSCITFWNTHICCLETVIKSPKRWRKPQSESWLRQFIMKTFGLVSEEKGSNRAGRHNRNNSFESPTTRYNRLCLVVSGTETAGKSSEFHSLNSNARKKLTSKYPQSYKQPQWLVYDHGSNNIIQLNCYWNVFWLLQKVNWQQTADIITTFSLWKCL